MAVEFVCGRPGKAMDRYLNEKAVEPVREDPTAPVYVITPRQYTYGTEAQIQEMLEAPGTIGLQVTSMEKLSRDILENVYGGALETVDTAGKSMLIRGILDARRDELGAYRTIASASDLPAAIAGQLARFRQMEITPAELSAYAEAHPELLRIRDLAIIYTALEEEMTGRVDTEGALALAMEHMEEAWFLRDARVILRGFSEWSTQEIAFARRLMDTAQYVYIELPAVPDGAPDEKIYAGSAAAAVRLSAGRLEEIRIHAVTPGEEPGGIVRTACELFGWGQEVPMEGDEMEIAAYRDAEQEVRSVAAEIVRLHLEERVPYEEMAIVWGETNEYEPLIRRIFSDAHIPYFTGDRKNLAQSNLAEYVLTACELTDGPLRKEALLAHAATGFTDLQPQELGCLANYANTMISWGRQFREDFAQDTKAQRLFRDDLGAADRARKKLMEPIEAYLRTDGKKRGAAASSVLEALETYTARTLTSEKMEDKAAQLEKDYEQVSFMEQSVRAIERILDQARDLLGDAHLSGADLRRILRAGFSAVQLSLVPAALKEVQAGPISTMYVPSVSHLFVVGVNDEVLPRFSEVSGDLLTSEEWDALVRELRSFVPMTRSEQQKYQIVRTMMQVRDKIHWSYHVGGETRESVLIGYLKGLYRTRGADPVTGEIPAEELRRRRLRLKQNAYERIVAQIRNAADGILQPEAGKMLIRDPELAAAVLFDPEFSERTAQLRESLVNLNEAVPVPPAHPNRVFSATRLQQYGKCPYSHFLHYQLGIWTPDDPIVDNRGTGILMHRILEKAAGFAHLGPEEFQRRIRAAADDARTEITGTEPHPRSWAFLEAAQGRALRGACILYGQMQQGALRPVATELPFHLDLGSGTGKIQGTIDRLDAAVIDGRRYLSVVDYKSSRHDLSLPDLFLGTDVQLVLYLLALEQLMQNGEMSLRPEDIIAGGGFLNLLPGFSDKLTSPEDIEAAYQIRGLLCIGPETAQKLYGAVPRPNSRSTRLLQFRQDVTGEGAYYAASAWRIFPAGQDGSPGKDFRALLETGRARLQEAARQTAAGVNRISPADSPMPACATCQFHSICRFEPDDPLLHIRRAQGTNAELRGMLKNSEAEEKGAG